MCNTPNPNFSGSINESGAQVAATSMLSFALNDGTVDCSHCGYINIGNNIQTCEGCGKNLNNISRLFEHFFNAYSTSQGAHNKIDSDSDSDDTKEENPNSNPPPKAAVAVEKALDGDQLVCCFNQYILLLNDHQQSKKSIQLDYLNDCMTELFQSIEYNNDPADGQLNSSTCQVCCDEKVTLVTMKACGHRVVCADDFHKYLSTRIHDENILPWIPCPAETCSVPCHVDNIIQDGNLTYSQIKSFLTTYMLKKLSRNENFITCINCEKGGFLQLGSSRKQQVTCPICHKRQTIEKGADGALDPAFKKMMKSGELRECPACRHLTFKETGICNVIQCVKCAIWWNWRTREQGEDSKRLKLHARQSGTLWEPGELRYQQELQHKDPKAFQALLERNGIAYNPNYVRGNWDD